MYNIYSKLQQMRFLFRIPKHQQFHIKPRYYDPVKEEIKERTERIKLRMEGNENGDYQPTRIEFRRKTKSVSGTSLLQLGIAALLGVLTMSWLYIGNEIFYYAACIAIMLYLFYRLKKLNHRK